MIYKKYLKSPHWKIKRKQTKSYYGDKCVICGTEKVDTHHLTYKRINKENHKTDLLPLCRKHHYEVHDYAKNNNFNIWNATMKLTRDYRKEAENNSKKLTWKQMTPFQREQFLGK